MNNQPKLDLTPLGTPFSPRWADAWRDFVVATETTLGRRICGAQTQASTPCEEPPANESGRCAGHGGDDRVGAVRRNQYAVQHGLYMRRLRPCSESCPLWESCPLAQRGVPEPLRAACQYELAEYEQTVRETIENLGLSHEEPAESAFEAQLARTAAKDYAQTRAMTFRAASMLAGEDLVVPNAKGQSTRIGASAQAYLRLERGQRNASRDLIAAARRLDERRKSLSRTARTQTPAQTAMAPTPVEKSPQRPPQAQMAPEPAPVSIPTPSATRAPLETKIPILRSQIANVEFPIHPTAPPHAARPRDGSKSAPNAFGIRIPSGVNPDSPVEPKKVDRQPAMNVIDAHAAAMAIRRAGEKKREPSIGRTLARK